MEPSRIKGQGFSIWEQVLSIVEDVTYEKTGRVHKRQVYDDIFGGIYPKKPGDIIVLLFSLDTKERIPQGYDDLLPRLWSEIEGDLDQGKTVELAGKARQMNIILLAAPRRSQLKPLIRESKLLNSLTKQNMKLQD